MTHPDDRSGFSADDNDIVHETGKLRTMEDDLRDHLTASIDRNAVLQASNDDAQQHLRDFAVERDAAIAERDLSNKQRADTERDLRAYRERVECLSERETVLVQQCESMQDEIVRLESWLATERTVTQAHRGLLIDLMVELMTVLAKRTSDER